MTKGMIGVGALKPNKVKQKSMGMTNFVSGPKFGMKRGNKISVPKATASKTHSS